MADTTSGLDSLAAEEPVAVGTVKPAAAKGPYSLGTSTIASGYDPELLANMQKLIEEKQAQKGSFMEGMKDAMAWWSGGVAGPAEALQNRALEKDRQEAELFGMKSQLSQAKIGMAQASAMRDQLFGNSSSPTATTTVPPSHITAGGPTAASSMVQQGGMLGLVEDPGLRQSIANQATRDPVGAQKAIQEYLAKNANKTDMIKDVQYMVQNGLLDPKLVPAAMLIKFAGASAFVPHDVLNVSPGGVTSTGQGTPFGAATGVAGSGGRPTGVPGAPAAPTAAPVAAPRPMPTQAPTAAPTGAPAAGAPQLTTPVPPAHPSTFAAPPPAAPASPATSTPQIPPEIVPVSREAAAYFAKKAEVSLAGGTEFAKETEKSNAVKASQVDTAALTAGERKSRFENVKSIIDDPDMQMAFGKMAKKGLTPFVIKQLESGINAGQFGTLGIGDLQRNLMEANMSPVQVDKLHQVENALKTAELEYSKTYLTGQGSVSDNERKLIQAAVGSIVKDPAKVLKTQVSVMAERADFDQKVGRLYDSYRDKNGEYASFGKFMRSEEARKLIDEHNSSLAKIIGRNKSELNDPFNTKGKVEVSTGSNDLSAFHRK
jgi:hypothetical protein